MHTPTHYTLVDLYEGERVILEVRRHAFKFYTRTLVLFVLWIIPLLLSPLFNRGMRALFVNENGSALFGFFFSLWTLLLFTLFFFRWTDYYLDVWIITTKRIFDVEQKGLFTRVVSVFRLEKVQDITVETRGIIATFLKFGDVHLYTAGESSEFVIRDAADPLMVKNVIIEAHGRTLENAKIPDAVAD
ncbi:MAG: PH domain-containing protein [Patescibacteria group bacterium]